MDRRESNLRALLDRHERGLTLRQIVREYKKLTGEVQFDEDGKFLEEALKSMIYVRTERASWGDTLYFLDSDDNAGQEERSKEGIFSNATNSSRYNVEDEVSRLVADDRGVYTICWNLMPSDNEMKIRQRFSTFGPISDVRLDKGKAFVRYATHTAAESAIREFGTTYFIEASRNPKKDKEDAGSKKRSVAVNNKPMLLEADNTSDRLAPEVEKSYLRHSDFAEASITAVRDETTSSQHSGNPELEIYVSDLPLEFDAIDLEEMFLEYDIKRIRMNASKSKRTAFIELGSRQEVEKALAQLCNRDDRRYYCASYKTLIRLIPRDPDLKEEFLARMEDDTAHKGSDRASQCASPLDVSGLGSGPKMSVAAQVPRCEGHHNGDTSRDTKMGNMASEFVLCKHARSPCRKYPKCLPNCDFRHPLCPLGIKCVDRFCSYDHLHRPKRCHLCIKQHQGPTDKFPMITQCEHRNSDCTDFPKCPYGIKCSFKHPSCPDLGCNAVDTCMLEHEGQEKICFICWKALKSSEGEKPAPIKNQGAAAWSLKENTPCRYDVKCWTPQCPYKHPPEWVKKACPWGHRCRRENCTFLHPPVIL